MTSSNGRRWRSGRRIERREAHPINLNDAPDRSGGFVLAKSLGIVLYLALSMHLPSRKLCKYSIEDCIFVYPFWPRAVVSPRVQASGGKEMRPASQGCGRITDQRCGWINAAGT